MATATIQLGPDDHGRAMTSEEFESATAQEGYQFELIHGRVVVAAAPNLPHFRSVCWLNLRLSIYAMDHPASINFVSPGGQVLVPDPDDATNPQPDIMAFRNYPLDRPAREVAWQDVSPILVIEVVSPDTANKDYVRNVELYLQVSSIREYWIIDPREDPDHPSLRAYRRRGQQWQRPIDVPGGGTYTTRLLPEFELVMDIRR
jgi:Uma2 family endonuclease